MKLPVLITRTVTATVLLAAKLLAQQTPNSTAALDLQAELQHLGAAAEAQIHSLPNFTCDETATSQIFRDHKLRTSMQVHGTVRVVRKSDGKLDENYVYDVPFFHAIFRRRLPFYVLGGFDSALNYFLPSAQPCYQFTLSPGRIDFATHTRTVPGYVCRERGLTGYALLDSDGDVTHIQRSIPSDVATPLKLTPFAAIDLAPVNLNGLVYLLSQHLNASGTLPNGDEAHFEATYANCKLFTATVTLGPSTEVPPSTTSPH